MFLKKLKFEKRKGIVHKLRREGENFLKILKIEKRTRSVFLNPINREEKENVFLKILKMEKRKRMDLIIS